VLKLKIDAHKAETDRLKVVTPAFGPAEIQALVLQTLQQALSSPDITPGATQQAQPAPAPQPQPEQPQPAMPPPDMGGAIQQ
jgi:hypothetical protein